MEMGDQGLAQLVGKSQETSQWEEPPDFVIFSHSPSSWRENREADGRIPNEKADGELVVGNDKGVPHSTSSQDFWNTRTRVSLDCTFAFVIGQPVIPPVGDPKVKGLDSTNPMFDVPRSTNRLERARLSADVELAGYI